jgi:hypothetical protein
MQKWFEGQSSNFQENNILMYNTLEKLENLINMKPFHSKMEDELKEYTNARSANIVREYEVKLKRYLQLETVITVTTYSLCC